MKSFRITIKGAVGDVLLVKLFDNGGLEYKIENPPLDTADEKVIIIDLTTVEYDVSKPILIAYNWSDNAPAGQFTIVNAEFSTEPATSVE